MSPLIRQRKSYPLKRNLPDAPNAEPTQTAGLPLEIQEEQQSSALWKAHRQREHRKERFERIYALTRSLESSGQSDDASNWCDTLFELADNNLELGRAYTLKATVKELQGSWRESLDAVQAGLQLFDIALPRDAEAINAGLKQYMNRTMEILKTRSIQSLVEMPQVSDARFEVIMKLLFRVIPSAVQLNPPLFMLADLMLFDLSVKHGTTSVAAKNFVDCGIIVGSMLQQWETGYELGMAAYQLLDKYPNSGLRCGVEFVFATYISHWKDHFSKSLTCFDNSIIAGLEVGDLSHTSYAFIHLLIRKLYVGRPLAECSADVERTVVFLENANTRNQTALTDIICRTIAELCSTPTGTNAPATLDDTEFVAHLLASNNAVDIGTYSQLMAWVGYLKQDNDSALEWSLHALPYVYALEGMFPLPDVYLLLVLSGAQHLSQQHIAVKSSPPLEKPLSHAMSRLQQWSKLCPANFAHKFHLAKAAMLQFEQQPDEEIRHHYAAALASIDASSFVNWRASIHAHRSQFLMRIGEKRAATNDLKEAIALYTQWGATAVAALLEKKLPMAHTDP